MKLFNIKKLSKKLFCTLTLGVFICLSLFIAFGAKKDEKNQVANAYIFANSDAVINDLSGQGTLIPESYNLLKDYPVVPENQTNSLLCWSYASLKALEISVMKNTNEYYNFSETAVAYIANSMGLTQSFNSTGTFENFLDVAYNYGLVEESLFSNNNYFDIDEDNKQKYTYVLDHVDRNVIKNYKPVEFKNSNIFSVTANNKITEGEITRRVNLMKRFIKTYGGMFAGLEAGVIYPSNTAEGVPMYENNPEKQTDDGSYITQHHAICLVGWDDRYGFLALNSWGVEQPKSYQTFYIPYDYLHTHNSAAGFVYSPTADAVVVETSSAGKFSTEVMKSSVLMSNMFCCNEQVNVSYSVADTVNFANVYIEIYKGTALVTQNFVIQYDDDDKKISLRLGNGTDILDGGTYVIKFFEDQKIVFTKSLFVFTGTEVTYFKLETDDRYAEVDSALLMNSFADGKSSETFYISSLESYSMLFYLTPFNSFKNTGANLKFSVGELYKYVYEGGEHKKVSTGLTFAKQDGTLKDFSNCYVVSIPQLVNEKNSKLEFSITIESTVFAGVKREYVITLFSSNFAETKTADAKIVHYEMNGGQNSPNNATRLPLSNRDGATSKFELFNPIKPGYVFMGWYVDSNFTTEITELNGSTNQDITIYARWSERNANYFSTALSVEKVYNYDGDEKLPSTNLIYGDKLELNFNFTVLNELSAYNFNAVYYLYVNGKQMLRADIGKVSKDIPIQFDINTLKAGNYTIAVNAVVVVSHSHSVTQTKSIKISVAKKQVNFIFDELEFVYDGLLHKPKIGVEENAFYSVDLAGREPTEMFEVSDIRAIDVNDYTFTVLGISNNNYTISGAESCTLKIKPKEISIKWKELSKTYNGEVQLPEYDIVGKIDGDSLNVNVNLQGFKNVGEYIVSTSDVEIDNLNYVLATEASETFKIVPAKLTITLENVTERIQISPAYRKKPTYIREGMLYDAEELLKLEILTDGLTTERSGKYPITATYNNKNYDIEFVNGEYVLSGDYTVYYKLPNGETYVENVKEGENPKGVPEDVYKGPKIGKIKYSQELVNSDQDLYIDVTEDDYTWTVVGIVSAFVVICIYVVVTHKKRKNKVS